MIPDDARPAFIASNVRCQFPGMAPGGLPGVEGVLAMRLRPVRNHPPVSR